MVVLLFESIASGCIANKKTATEIRLPFVGLYFALLLRIITWRHSLGDELR